MDNSIKQIDRWIGQQNSFLNNLKNCLGFNREKVSSEALKNIQFIENQLDKLNNDEHFLRVGNALIKRFKKNPKLKPHLLRLDHKFANLRLLAGENKHFTLKENSISFKKWEGYGFDPEIFYDHPEFVEFLFRSTLASQIKVTRDVPKIIHGEPAIRMGEGWLTFTKLRENFEMRYRPEYADKALFHKQTGQVFTYLDTGEGLTQLDPFKNAMKKPVSRLSNYEYEKTLEVAKKFVRDGENIEDRQENNKDRSYIMQIVTSEDECKVEKNPLLKNFYQLFFKAKHPYMRLIDPEGKVYISGFGVFKENMYWAMQTDPGRIRSPDAWEYKTSPKKYVTNIAVTPEEANKLRDYTSDCINEDKTPVAFNFLKQNCSSFVRNAVEYSTGIKVPSELTFARVIATIAPNYIKIPVNGVCGIVTFSFRPVKWITPKFIQKAVGACGKGYLCIHRATIAFRLALLSLCVGGIQGKRGRALMPTLETKEMAVPQRRLSHWIDLSYYKFNCPSLVQEWQKMHNESTVVYKNPIKLTISAA